MRILILFLTIFLMLGQRSAGQTVDITGTWKQPRAIHVRNYTFDSTGVFKHDEYGDLLEFHLTGHYRVSSDSIFLSYDSIIDISRQFRKHSPVNDTLFIVNKNVIKVSEYLHVFNDDRSDYKISTDGNGIFNFKIKNFGDTFLLQHYIFNKWRTIDTFSNPSGEFLIIENRQLPLHSGKNQFRIKSRFDLNFLKRFEVESKKKKITIKSKTITDKIQFSDQTYYELYDKHGVVIKKGTGDTVDCSTLPKGKYILDYDNDWVQIKKK